MTRALAFMGRRVFNRTDAAAISSMCALLSHEQWIAAGCAIIGGLVLSAICEGAALSKRGGGTLT